MRWSDGIANSVDMKLSNLQERVENREAGVLQSMRSQRVGHNTAAEQQHTFTYGRHAVGRFSAIF